VAYIRKQGGSRSGTLCQVTWELLQFHAQEVIVLVPRHVMSQLCLLWDRPTIDLFATRLNKRLPLYISTIPDEDALEVDSLTASWDGLNAYA